MGALKLSARCLVLAALLFLYLGTAVSQLARGELHITIQDPQGAFLVATAELVNTTTQTRNSFSTDSQGQLLIRGLPFGAYRLTVTAQHFYPWTGVIEIRSEVPVAISQRLTVAQVNTRVDVNAPPILVDPYTPAPSRIIDDVSVRENIPAQPARGLSDLVNDLPGWLYEANGVLHPRGSEYDVQYVVDGLPVTENQSPAFAPPYDANDVDWARVMTAAYPAEFGRKLGGVVEVTSNTNQDSGVHGHFDLEGGSFVTSEFSGDVSYVYGKDRITIQGDGFGTDRYLDPPVLENFTNNATAKGFGVAYEHDFSDDDRLRLSVTHTDVHFLVPNELIQQDAGQRQHAADGETGGAFYFEHAISADMLVTSSGSVRDASASLSSNALSTPIVVSQSRGYREGYGRADLAAHHSHHDWKIGVDTIFNPVHEQLEYAITDPSQFDAGTQLQFQFSEHHWDLEPSAYAQDEIHFKNWTVSAGLRFDHYSFLVHESAWSPRLAVSRYFAALELSVHAAYDRVFQTPAIENLLLASSPQIDSVDPIVSRLPVRPARANFYEAGVSKALFGTVRMDATIFRRNFQNFSDDDVLLDTGVSFPIAFSGARVIGEELRLEVAKAGRFSGFLSYANQSGIGYGPITGGLFLGEDAADALTGMSRFAISQDQRNTARARIRFQAQRRLWLAVGGQYDSGLPADTGDSNTGFLLGQYGPAILSQVNLDRNRVRPIFVADAAAGVDVYHKEHKSASLDIQITNLADRVEVINFASLFSGTALGVPRSATARLRLTF